MKLRNVFLLFVIGILFNSCFVTHTSYEKCMTSYKKQTTIDFYKSLEALKNELLTRKLIKEKDKRSYLIAIQEINKKQDKWKKVYSEIKNKGFIKDIDASFFYFTSVCSDLKKSNKNFYNLECNNANIQKFFFNQIPFKSATDREIIEGLVLFSDINKKFDNLNLVYLIYLNLYENYN